MVRYNSVNIWWTLTSKQYALLNIMAYLYIKLQLDRMKYVGGVSWNFYKNFQRGIWVDHNLETVYAAPHHGLTIYQVSA